MGVIKKIKKKLQKELKKYLEEGKEKEMIKLKEEKEKEEEKEMIKKEIQEFVEEFRRVTEGLEGLWKPASVSVSVGNQPVFRVRRGTDEKSREEIFNVFFYEKETGDYKAFCDFFLENNQRLSGLVEISEEVRRAWQFLKENEKKIKVSFFSY